MPPKPGAVVTVTLYNESFRLWDKYKVAQRGIVTKTHADDPKLIDAMVSVNGVMVEKTRIPHESIAAPPVDHPYWSSWCELPA